MRLDENQHNLVTHACCHARSLLAFKARLSRSSSAILHSALPDTKAPCPCFVFSWEEGRWKELGSEERTQLGGGYRVAPTQPSEREGNAFLPRMSMQLSIVATRAAEQGGTE